MDDLKKFYQEKKVSESFSDLMSQIDLNKDNIITFDEFIDYYTNLSPSFNEDFAFEKFVETSWVAP